MEMENTLIDLAGKKALIIPENLLKKYEIEKCVFEETDEGILIKPVDSVKNFSSRLNDLRKERAKIYAKMRDEANDPEIQKYYAQNV